MWGGDRGGGWMTLIEQVWGKAGYGSPDVGRQSVEGGDIKQGGGVGASEKSARRGQAVAGALEEQ